MHGYGAILGILMRAAITYLGHIGDAFAVGDHP